MNHLSDPAQRQAVLHENTHAGTIAIDEPVPQPTGPAGEERSPKIRTDLPIPPVAYLDRKARSIPDRNEIWSYINPYMIFGRHMGFRGNFEKALKERDPRALELFHSMEEVKREAESFMKISAVWQFFEAEREGNSIALFEPGKSSPIHKFHFQRRRVGDKLCLSDYVLPPNPAPSSNGAAQEIQRDHLALFVVTAGAGVRERAEEAKAAGRYLFSHGLQALAIETAEACAEWLHRRIREDWGFPDPPTLTMADRFTSRYRGKRYSFGYPACPNLDDQAGIWMLLHPEEIGVHLTEGMMMDPEASVSALVFQHPDCTYFTVGDQPEPPQ
jgi:5-methyltetrahydrofolate--homocysteine methyltransferase